MPLEKNLMTERTDKKHSVINSLKSRISNLSADELKSEYDSTFPNGEENINLKPSSLSDIVWTFIALIIIAIYLYMFWLFPIYTGVLTFVLALLNLKYQWHSKY